MTFANVNNNIRIIQLLVVYPKKHINLLFSLRVSFLRTNMPFGGQNLIENCFVRRKWHFVDKRHRKMALVQGKDFGRTNDAVIDGWYRNRVMVY